MSIQEKSRTSAAKKEGAVPVSVVTQACNAPRTSIPDPTKRDVSKTGARLDRASVRRVEVELDCTIRQYSEACVESLPWHPGCGGQSQDVQNRKEVSFTSSQISVCSTPLTAGRRYSRHTLIRWCQSSRPTASSPRPNQGHVMLMDKTRPFGLRR